MSQKLQKSVADLASANTRQIMGIAKQQIKVILFNEMNNPNCEPVVEEFLKAILLESRLLCLLPVFEECVDGSEFMSKGVQNVMKRHLQHEVKDSKTEETKRIKMFLISYTLKKNSFLESLMKEVKNSEDQCCKLVELVELYFSENQIIGNITEIIVLLLHLLKSHEIVSEKTIHACLRLMSILIIEIDDLRESLEETLKKCSETLIMNKIALSEALKIFNFLMVRCENCELYQNQAEKIFNFIITEVIQPNIDFSKIKFGYQNNEKNRLQFENTFHQISDFLLIFCQCSHQMGNQEILAKICNLTEGISCIRIEKVIANCLKIFSYLQQNCQLQVSKEVCLKILLTSCLPSNYPDQIARMYQNQMINRIGAWIDENGMFLSENNAESCLQYFFQSIKLNIEKQFQFQFDEGQFLNSCNLLSCLSEPISHLSQQQSKEKIRQFIKMLLNLNESCQLKFKKIITRKTIELLMIFSDILLPNNDFLKEVLEDQLLKKPSEFAQDLKKLCIAKNYSQKLISKIRQKLNDKDYSLGEKRKEVQFLWELTFMISDNPEVENMSSPWFVVQNYVGKRKLKERWKIDVASLKIVQEDYKKLPIEYRYQLGLMSQMEGM